MKQLVLFITLLLGLSACDAYYEANGVVIFEHDEKIINDASVVLKVYQDNQLIGQDSIISDDEGSYQLHVIGPGLPFQPKPLVTISCAYTDTVYQINPINLQEEQVVLQYAFTDTYSNLSNSINDTLYF